MSVKAVPVSLEETKIEDAKVGPWKRSSLILYGTPSDISMARDHCTASSACKG